jgi:hypothetical protein
MQLLVERALREQADTATNKMLTLWSELCLKELHKPMEVMVCNRREHPNFSSYPGQVNIANPVALQGKPVLVLFMENTIKLNFIIISHELGHWVLKLQGREAVINHSDFHSEIEIFLNSLCSHPAVYKLQREMGHEPQSEIDSRANHDIAIISRYTEPTEIKLQIRSALVFSDDLINCSASTRKGLQNSLSKNYPKTEKIVNEILECKGSKDLSINENASTFVHELINRLDLGKNWQVVDNLGKLRDYVVNPT